MISGFYQLPVDAVVADVQAIVPGRVSHGLASRTTSAPIVNVEFALPLALNIGDPSTKRFS